MMSQKADDNGKLSTMAVYSENGRFMNNQRKAVTLLDVVEASAIRKLILDNGFYQND